MAINTNRQNYQREARIRQGIWRRARQLFIQNLIIGVILFLGSGRPGWVWAWLYLGYSILQILVNFTFMRRTNPELIAERAEGSARTQPWDRTIVAISAPLWLAILIIAALDERWAWSTVPLWVNLVGAALLVLGSSLSSWAMLTNAYFSGAVRIQQDRGQTVITEGPYRFVRHPGYLGWAVVGLSMALLFGSLWALIPAGLILGPMIVRTALEDRTLQEGLEGYREYAQQVRYRLVPGVW
ncbi:MAG: isoprenylcysteine carboxylmethyltransferase family protein [Anaerolineales bacterium]|nr:MAG: isoprenylcysteine carboxylmethyltransferase family protein [Anaerolineales bacterium]